jgi:hypothetical protein
MGVEMEKARFSECRSRIMVSTVHPRYEIDEFAKPSPLQDKRLKSQTRRLGRE